MPKYLIFNTVNNDGVGDFSHFEDIIKTLLADPKFSDVEFVPIVCFSSGGKESNYVRIGEKLKALGIPFIYGKNDDHKRFIEDEAIQNQIKDADQAIIISYDQIFKQYYPHLKSGIPIKSVAEHEQSIITMNHDIDVRILHHNLGLGASRDGIKIKETSHITPREAWDTIQKHDPNVAKKLLECTNSPDFENLHNRNVITPAYFNNATDFISYLLFLSMNDSLSQDAVVYLSGINLAELRDEYLESMADCFHNTEIQQIEVYQPGNDSPMRIPGNPSGTRSIKILSGFFLSDPSFDSLYQMSNIAGVSGDNTLERCISMSLLPFYWSTNGRTKIQTLLTLQKITQLPELDISAEARASFNILFNPDEFFSCSRMVTAFQETDSQNKYEKAKGQNHYNELNFPKIFEAWPVINEYLRKNKNYYDKLEGIVLEALPFQSRPTHFQKESSASLKLELQQHREKFDALLKELHDLRTSFGRTNFQFESSVNELHKNLSAIGAAFFEKGENIDERAFNEFKLACETRMKKAEKIFQLESPGAWNDYIKPVLKGLLGVVIAIAVTLLTIGILPIIVARNETARTMYINTFFKPESKEVTQDKETWHSYRFKQKLFGDDAKQEKGIMDEIKETVNRQPKA